MHDMIKKKKKLIEFIYFFWTLFVPEESLGNA